MLRKSNFLRWRDRSLQYQNSVAYVRNDLQFPGCIVPGKTGQVSLHFTKSVISKLSFLCFRLDRLLREYLLKYDGWDGIGAKYFRCPRHSTRKSWPEVFPEDALALVILFWFRLYWIQSWTSWTQLQGGDTKIRPRNLPVLPLLSCILGTCQQ